jgi:microcystin-dependent protein
MPLVTIPRTYSDTVDLYASDLNTAFDAVETAINTTKLDSTNVQAGGIITTNLADGLVTTPKLAASSVTTINIADANITLAKAASEFLYKLVPTGVVLPYAGTLAPNGFIFSVGTASRTTYATLFAAIGTTFGAGDGTTTFGLPDPAGRALIGAGAGASLTARALGVTLGEETHLLTLAETPAHTHSYNAPAGDQAIYAGGGASSASYGMGSRTTSSVGSGTAHNVMQPSLALNFIIKY